jgi:wyosine [tRNA(Phe)-imidazoG37] synthetase (radical SAM superfamily)
MLVGGMNDTEASILEIKAILDQISFDRLFINTPVRPPAESEIVEPTSEALESAIKILGGTAINHLVSDGFSSNIPDDFDAVKSIIKRHPMNQFEITSFLESRDCAHVDKVFRALEEDSEVGIVRYKGYLTYRG